MAKYGSAVAAGILTAALALSACGRGPSVSPSITPTPSQTTFLQNPALDLTTPGVARKIISLLHSASGNKPVIRVEITRTSANLTYVDGTTAATIGYVDGHISALDSTVRYINQTTFDPANFNLDNIPQLFATAAKLSGSDLQQDLQINEYNHGQVLMTVTTTPESSTVFFQPDGTAITTLDFHQADGIRAGIADTVGNANSVQQIQIKPDSLTTDIRLDPATVERHTRQNSLPTLVVSIKDSSKSASFNPSSVNPETIARLLNSLPSEKQQNTATAFTVTINQNSSDNAPRMHFQFSSTEITTDLEGNIVSR